MPASAGKSRRTSGSPPVSRTSPTPMSASSVTSRTISSKLRTSSRSSHGSPSAGMQYWQRKLQRSVADTRTSEMRRPWPSISGSRGMGSSVAGGELRPGAQVLAALREHERETQRGQRQERDDLERRAQARRVGEHAQDRRTEAAETERHARRDARRGAPPRRAGLLA